MPPGLGMCWRQLTTRPFGRRAGVNRCKVQYGRGRASANKEGGHAAILANSGVKTAFAENSLTNLARLIRANYSLFSQRSNIFMVACYIQNTLADLNVFLARAPPL